MFLWLPCFQGHHGYQHYHWFSSYHDGLGYQSFECSCGYLAFRVTMVTNITIDLLLTMMSLVTRVSNVPVGTLLSGSPWLPTLPLIF